MPARPSPRLDRFAELIGEPPYLTPQQAALRMGMAEKDGNRMMQRLRSEVGREQAR